MGGGWVACEILLSALGLGVVSILDSQFYSQVPGPKSQSQSLDNHGGFSWSKTSHLPFTVYKWQPITIIPIMNIIRHYSRAVMTLRVRNIKSLEYAFVKGKWVWCWVLDRYHRLRDPFLPRLTQALGSDNVLLRLHYGHNLGFKYSGLRVSLFIICQLVSL